MSTPTRSPLISRKNHHQNPNNSMDLSSSTTNTEFKKSKFEANNRLQAATVAFGEKLHIHEIIVIGVQSNGKSSLLKALFGFRFHEVEMGTRRPLILQMVHDESAFEPRCRFQISISRAILRVAEQKKFEITTNATGRLLFLIGKENEGDYDALPL